MSRAIWKRGRGLGADIIEALEATGLPWEVEIGTKHRKIMVGGKLAGVVPIKGTGGRGGDGRNIVAAIKRAGRARDTQPKAGDAQQGSARE